MPIYEYKCIICEHVQEVTKSIDEVTQTDICEKCGAGAVRQYGTFGIQFKGPGFYSTDKGK